LGSETLLKMAPKAMKHASDAVVSMILFRFFISLFI
jgi:hypothetical protein